MTMTEKYHDCLQAMYSLKRFGIKLGLDVIKTILANLNNPQNSFQAIHIAGTNGKGSVAAALANIFQAAGYCTGLYTSPHLVHFNERICTNGQPISDESVLKSFNAVQQAHASDREPTFFEYTTAMAFHEFARRNVQWAVIETGMGGRLDATNILEPRLSIVTNVSMEHQEYLGNSLAQIAAEKGGIIKPNVPVITGVHQKSALHVVKQIALKQSAPLYRRGHDFRVRRCAHGAFNYYGIDHIWRKMKAGLLGNHQIDNAALTLAACETLQHRGAKLTEEMIRSGLLQTQWPGRLELISEKPAVLLDGAHNLEAAKALARFLETDWGKHNITLVAGISDDKAYRPMLECLLPVCRRAILTRPKIERAMQPEKLLPVARSMIDDIQIVTDVEAAVRQAVSDAGPGDAVCVAGSLYLVGEAREALQMIGLGEKDDPKDVADPTEPAQHNFKFQA